jgi:hypothetical protein
VVEANEDALFLSKPGHLLSDFANVGSHVLISVALNESAISHRPCARFLSFYGRQAEDKFRPVRNRQI